MIPAASNETTTTLVELANVAKATVDVEETHLIYVRDIFMNAQDDFDDTLKVTLTHTDGVTVVNGVVT